MAVLRRLILIPNQEYYFHTHTRLNGGHGGIRTRMLCLRMALLDLFSYMAVENGG